MSRSMRSTRTLSKKPTLPASKGSITSIQMQKKSTIIELIDRTKGVDYSALTEQMEEAGTTYTPTREDMRRYNNPFYIYEMMFGGSPDYFRSPHYDGVRKREKEFLDVLVRDSRIVEGTTECPKCGYTKVAKQTLRLRGGDEPDANRLRCARCQNEWTVSK
jgi:DNA-directed RNA polymerase subunit M/transcription elongation factor TFIIS